MNLKIVKLSVSTTPVFEKHKAAILAIVSKLKGDEAVSAVELKEHLRVGSAMWARLVRDKDIRPYTGCGATCQGRMFASKETIKTYKAERGWRD